MNKYNRWLAGLMVAGALGASFASQAQIVVDIDARPPPPREEHRPPPPRPEYVWANGYWRWDEREHRHVWVEGHYIEPRPGYHWVDDHWDEHDGRYHYEPGHWVP